MSAGPGDADDLHAFLGGVDPDGISLDSVENLEGMMARMKADVVERGGDNVGKSGEEVRSSAQRHTPPVQ